MASQDSKPIPISFGPYSTESFLLSSANLPSNIGSSCEAEQLIGDARELRVAYQDMKSDTLYHLQQLLDRAKWIDDKILEVDIHIGRIHHVIEKSGLSIPPPVVARKKSTVIVEGAVHSVRVGNSDVYLSVTLD